MLRINRDPGGYIGQIAMNPARLRRNWRSNADSQELKCEILVAGGWLKFDVAL
jgi:hypothetical protein